MRWLKKKVREQIWTDTQIDLYERQMAARAALGTKYICHAMNDLPRKDTPLEVTPTQWTEHPVPRKLRLVK